MKLKTSSRQLAFIGIMTSVNVLWLILSLYLPLFSSVLFIGLPLASLLVQQKTDFRHCFIYAFCTLLLSCLLSIQDALFFVVPCLFSGLLFGFLLQKRMHSFPCILLVSAFNTLLQFLSFCLILWIFHTDMKLLLQSLFQMSEEQTDEIFLTVCFLIAFIQTLIGYFVIEGEAKKFHIAVHAEKSAFLLCLILALLSASFGCALLLLLPAASHLLTGIGVISSCYLLTYILSYRSRMVSALSAGIYIVFFFMFLFLCSSVFPGNQPYLLYS